MFLALIASMRTDNSIVNWSATIQTSFLFALHFSFHHIILITLCIHFLRISLFSFGNQCFCRSHSPVQIFHSQGGVTFFQFTFHDCLNHFGDIPLCCLRRPFAIFFFKEDLQVFIISVFLHNECVSRHCFFLLLLKAPIKDTRLAI